jgi:hypothetical protein
MKNNNVLPPLRHKPYGGAWSVHDQESTTFIKNLHQANGNRELFIQDYYQWFQEGINLIGIKGFDNLDFVAGTTETFHMFYYRHLDKRLRLFKDEYFYHHMMRRNYFKEYLEIDHNTLAKGDVVVMSCPFSGTGSIPENFYDILKTCDELSIPVMLDLAYINISNIKDLNVDFSCIETITTSLSKVFPVENFRIGIRLQRNLYDDPVHAYNQNNYVNLQSVHMGHELIKKFDNKWLVNKYKGIQLETCNALGVQPSDCVIFGLAEKGSFDEYNRDGSKNRLCFSRVWDGRLDEHQT